MPFDGLTKLRNDYGHLSGCSIEVILASLGIEAVPDAVLQKHKAQEIARHPASLFHRRPDLHVLFTLLSFIGTVMLLFVGTSPYVVNRTGLGVTCCLSIICFAMMIKLTLFTTLVSPASWIEGYPTKNYRRMDGKLKSEFASVPAPIMALVEQIRTVAPDAEFTIGTLFQKRVALDPYILVSNGTTSWSACLGIWDGRKIIQIAQQT